MAETSVGSPVHDWAVRLVTLVFLLVVVVMRGSLANPLMAYVLAGSWLDRLVTKLRPALTWGMFIGQSAHFVDVRVAVRLRSGQTHAWYVLRDGFCGTVRMHRRIFRTGLVSYAGVWRASTATLADAIKRAYADAKDPLVELVIARERFSSEGPQDAIVARAHPVDSIVLHHELVSEPAAGAVTDRSA